MSEFNAKEYIEAIAKRAKNVTYEVMSKSTKEKNAALAGMAKSISQNWEQIETENKKDVEFSKSIGKSKAIIDRLVLDEQKIKAMANAIEDVIRLPDPVGSGSFITRRPNGLKIQKVRGPIGVVGIIFESRPNVASDAACLTLKSGNTVILRGGKESIHSNVAIAELIRKGLKKAGFPEDAVQMIDRTEHEIVDEMLQLHQYIDVVIPRGGESLIRSVVEKSKIPVIFHDKGVCYIFVDESADRTMAERIIINAKCQKPSVCNAVEALLIHKGYPYKKEMVDILLKNKVEIFADETLRKINPDLKKAAEENWSTEYLDYKITAGVVKDVLEAIERINHYGSHHSDAIISENYDHVEIFLDKVDSATVYANASTRFTDGSEFGLGAEIGISTQKLHARGPMGLESLTSEKWVIYGSGQIRE